MKKIKIAQIGIGHDHASAVWESLIRNRDRFDVVGWHAPADEKARFADRSGVYARFPELTLEEAVGDGVDAVAVETEEVSLTKFALAAARAGKHIHMDKPGGLSSDEFAALVRTAKDNGTVLHLGYMYRYNPVIADVVQRAKAGAFGEIYSVEAQMNCWHPPEKRQWLQAFPGGMMFYLGCHLVDLVLQIQGRPDRIVPFNRPVGADGVTADDFGMAVFEYPHGASFIKTCAAEAGGYLRRQLVVCGTRGTAEIRPLEESRDGGLYTVSCEHGAAECGWNERGRIKETGPFDRYDAMLRAFGEMAAGEKDNPFTYDYELDLYRTVLAACGGRNGLA